MTKRLSLKLDDNYFSIINPQAYLKWLFTDTMYLQTIFSKALMNEICETSKVKIRVKI